MATYPRKDLSLSDASQMYAMLRRDTQEVLSERMSDMIQLAIVTHPNKLRIEGLPLSHFPEGFIPSCLFGTLEMLYFCGNQLQDLPASLEFLNQVRVLHIEQNQFAALPDVLLRMLFLRRIYAAGNFIAELPLSICQGLNTLLFLDLSMNKLRVIPECVCHLESLQELLLSDNALDKLPISMMKMTHLSKIDLSKNAFVAVPSCLLLHQAVVDLNLSRNVISVIPETLRNNAVLSYLDISFNNITALPVSLGMMEDRLMYLNVEGNPITDLPSEVIKDGGREILRFLADLCPPDASKSLVVSPKGSLELAQHEVLAVVIEVRNWKGSLRYRGGDAQYISLTLYHVLSDAVVACRASVKDLKNGSYQCLVPLPVAGICHLVIDINHESISGGPIVCSVYPKAATIEDPDLKMLYEHLRTVCRREESSMPRELRLPPDRTWNGESMHIAVAPVVDEFAASLRVLSFRDFDLGPGWDSELLEILALHPQLEVLNLIWSHDFRSAKHSMSREILNHRSNVLCRAMQGLPSTLTRIFLERVSLNDQAWKLMLQMVASPTLVGLRFTSCGIPGYVLTEDFFQLLATSSLEDFGLSQNLIDEEDTCLLLHALAKNTALRSLHLDASLTVKHLQAGTGEALRALFAASRMDPKSRNSTSIPAVLSYLDLHDNQLDDEAMCVIFEELMLQSGQATLHTLDLSGNTLTDASMGVFCGFLEHNKVLHSLRMRDCPLSARFFHAISKVMETHFVLRELDLTFNGEEWSQWAKTKMDGYLERNFLLSLEEDIVSPKYEAFAYDAHEDVILDKKDPLDDELVEFVDDARYGEQRDGEGIDIGGEASDPPCDTFGIRDPEEATPFVAVQNEHPIWKEERPRTLPWEPEGDIVLGREGSSLFLASGDSAFQASAEGQEGKKEWRND